MNGAWEWAGLVGLNAPAERAIDLGVMVAALALASWVATQPAMRQLVLAATVVWWAVAMVWIRRYSLDPHGFLRGVQRAGAPNFPPHWLFGMLGIVVLVPAWIALVAIHDSLAGR